MKIKTAELISLSVNDVISESAVMAALAVSHKLTDFKIELKGTCFITSGQFERFLTEALSRSDMVVITGTGVCLPSLAVNGICSILKCRTAESDTAKEIQKKYHHKRGHGRPGYCLENSRIPPGAELFVSDKNAEVGYAVTLEKLNKAILVLPGDSSDISRLGQAGFDAYLKNHSGQEYHTCRVNLIGCAMKTVYREAARVCEDLGVRAEVSQLVGESCISLSAESEKNCQKALQALRSSEVGGYIYGVDTGLAAEIVRLLKKTKRTVTFAESCTGGMIASMLVGVPGSSEVFDGSLVTYANQVKHDYLDVRSSTLEKEGAVSRKCAAQMAEGARRAMDADIGVAVTGIAGPGGGTAEKPVGLVYIAISERGEAAVVHKFNIAGDRMAVRTATAKYALRELYSLLAGRK